MGLRVERRPRRHAGSLSRSSGNQYEISGHPSETSYLINDHQPDWHAYKRRRLRCVLHIAGEMRGDMGKRSRDKESRAEIHIRK